MEDNGLHFIHCKLLHGLDINHLNGHKNFSPFVFVPLDPPRQKKKLQPGDSHGQYEYLLRSLRHRANRRIRARKTVKIRTTNGSASQRWIFRTYLFMLITPVL
jgi:hypothetical protein